MQDSTSTMGVLQERNSVIYQITVISWHVQLLRGVLYTETQTRLLLFIETIIIVSMNIIILSSYNTSTLQVLYYSKKILKVVFIIQTSSTLLHMNLILHTLHFVIQKFLLMKLCYLLLERKLV